MRQRSCGKKKELIYLILINNFRESTMDSATAPRNVSIDCAISTEDLSALLPSSPPLSETEMSKGEVRMGEAGKYNIFSKNFQRVGFSMLTLVVLVCVASSLSLEHVDDSLPSSSIVQASLGTSPTTEVGEAENADQQLHPCSLVETRSQQIVAPDGFSLAPGVTFSTLLNAMSKEYLSDRVNISAIDEFDDDYQEDLLENAFRVMQQKESEIDLYLPGTIPTHASGSSISRPLIGVTYTLLRKAVLKNYFASPPDKTQPWRQLSSALAVMHKVETDGVPVQIEGYPYLHIGGVGAAYNFTSLLEAGITHIVNTAPSVIVRYPGVFTYKHIADVYDHVYSDNSLEPYFGEISEFIEGARTSGGKVLVHCRKGRSRSATLIAAYLMEYHGFTRDPALALIRKTRPITKLSSKFMADLEHFERNRRIQHANDDSLLPKGVTILDSDGSLSADVQYSTIRRAIIGEYVDLSRIDDLKPWAKLVTGLEAMQRADLRQRNDNKMKQDGPLAEVTYLQLESALFNKFNKYFASSKGNSVQRMGQVKSILWTMRMIEVDGEPVPIGGKDLNIPPTLFIGGAGE